MGVLGFMSFVMTWIAVERFLFLRRVDIHRFTDSEDLHVTLTRHLTLLASVGANAPYVGLLGTVLGILVTFYDIGHSGIIDTQAIMVGLAFALKSTALGLLVAIPAISFYNGLVRRVEVLTADWSKARRHEAV